MWQPEKHVASAWERIGRSTGCAAACSWAEKSTGTWRKSPAEGLNGGLGNAKQAALMRTLALPSKQKERQNGEGKKKKKTEHRKLWKTFKTGFRK